MFHCCCIGVSESVVYVKKIKSLTISCNNIHSRIYHDGIWQSESGAGAAVVVSIMVAAGVTIRVQPPDASGATRDRRSGPLCSSRAALIGNLKDRRNGQGRALHIGICLRFA